MEDIIDKNFLYAELIKLNNEVEECIKKRTKFLDENMKYFAEFQIGDKVYNCHTRKTGICSEHYRYSTANNKLYDTSLYAECRIEEPIGSHCYDNTSRFSGSHPWVKYKEYENKTDVYINKLESMSQSIR